MKIWDQRALKIHLALLWSNLDEIAASLKTTCPISFFPGNKHNYVNSIAYELAAIQSNP